MTNLLITCMHSCPSLKMICLFCPSSKDFYSFQLLVEIYLLVVRREELITNFNSHLRTYTLEFIAWLKLTTVCLKNHMTSRKLLKYAHLEPFKNQNVKFFSCSFLTILQK